MLHTYKNENGHAFRSGSLNLGINLKGVTTTVKENALNKWKNISKNTFSIGEFTNNYVLSSLPEEDFARLLPHLQILEVASGENIYHSGDAGYYIYFPESAVFSQLNVLEDGRTVETAMVGNEGILGISAILSSEQDNSTTPWTQTIIGGKVYRIYATVFKQEFSSNISIHSVFLEYLNKYIKQVSQKVVCNNHHLIEERFSTWLLMLDDRCGNDGLELTQEQIAHFLGVHRPSVTCIAQDLRKKGIIAYSRGQIKILDRSKLESSACECYVAVN